MSQPPGCDLIHRIQQWADAMGYAFMDFLIRLCRRIRLWIQRKDDDDDDSRGGYLAAFPKR